MKILKELEEDVVTGPHGIYGEVLRKCYLAWPITRLNRMIVAVDTLVVSLVQTRSGPQRRKLQGRLFDIHREQICRKSNGDSGRPLLRRCQLLRLFSVGIPPGNVSCGPRDLLDEHFLDGACVGEENLPIPERHRWRFRPCLIDRLIHKLQCTVLCTALLRLIISFLESRRAKVIVNETYSDVFILRDMNFQDTVFGSLLWNKIISDIDPIVTSQGFDIQQFSDNFKLQSLRRSHKHGNSPICLPTMPARCARMGRSRAHRFRPDQGESL